MGGTIAPKRDILEKGYGMFKRDREGFMYCRGDSSRVCKDVVSSEQIRSFFGRSDATDEKDELTFGYSVERVVVYLDPSTVCQWRLVNVE